MINDFRKSFFEVQREKRKNQNCKSRTDCRGGQSSSQRETRLRYRRSYGRRRREHDVLRYACVYDQERNRYGGCIDDYDGRKILGRHHRPVYGIHIGQHSRKVGKKKTVYVLWRHILVPLHIPRVPARERMGYERRRIYGVHNLYVSALEHLLDGHASAVLLDVKRYYAVVQRA